MHRRCDNETQASFHNYGGRGIRVCERWKSFEFFLADMGEQPDGMTLERSDSNGNYEPGNCIWATKLEQARNKRSNVVIEFGGRSQCISAWAEELGLKAKTLRARIFDHGLSIEEALTRPISAHKFGPR